MAVEDDNGALVRSWYETVWNQGHLEAIDSFINDDFANFGRRGTNARTVLREIVSAWRMAFPDLHFEVEEEICSLEQVVVRMMVRGTYRGPFRLLGLAGVAPTGRAFAVDQIHIHRVRDGRIVEHWAVRNDLEMLQQLGVLASSF